MSYSDLISLFMFTYMATLKELFTYYLTKARISLKSLADISNCTLHTFIHSYVVSKFIVYVSGRMSWRFKTPIL